MVRYKVTPDRAETTGIRYATVVLDDGVSFIHIAAQDADTNPLLQLDAFQEFQRNIGDRCDEAPVLSEFRQVGSYRLFGE
jgi:hypothetical protein